VLVKTDTLICVTDGKAPRWPSVPVAMVGEKGPSRKYLTISYTFWLVQKKTPANRFYSDGVREPVSLGLQIAFSQRNHPNTD